MTDRCTVPTCRGDDEPREAVPGTYLCQPDATLLRNQLSAMPALVNWLELHIAKGGTAAFEPVTGSREAPVPLNLRILSVIGDSAHFTVHEGIDPETGKLYRDQEDIPNIRTTLVGWTKIAAERLEFEDDQWPADTIEGMSAWLADRIQWFVQQDFVDAMAVEIRDLHNYAWRLAPIRVGRQKLFRPCPSCDLMTLVLECVDPENDRRAMRASRGAMWPRVVCDHRSGGCSRVWREGDYEWLAQVLNGAVPESGDVA